MPRDDTPRAVDWFYVVTWKYPVGQSYRSGVLEAYPGESAWDFHVRLLKHLGFPHDAVLISYFREPNRAG